MSSGVAGTGETENDNNNNNINIDTNKLTTNIKQEEDREHEKSKTHSRIASKILSHHGAESSDEEVYDPQSEGPQFDRAVSSEDLPEEYEHHHDPNIEEFRLIPHHDDSDKWKIYIPIIYWLPRYKWKSWFLSDIIAAITAIVMVIPQSMGYALVAGLKPIYGLYSALMGHCLYGPFGTSGQLIVAPVAIVSLMTKETLHVYFKDADHTDPDINIKMAAYGSCLAFQSGIICLVAGFCKAGILANMLAEPVIVGFTFAAAILIALSQFKFIFQVDAYGAEAVSQLIHFFENIEEVHGASVALAVCCILFLLIMRWWQNAEKRCPKSSKYAKFIPSALILVVICTAISYSLGESTGWTIVGELPPGLPDFKNFFDYIDEGDFWSLWVPALLITVLSFIESIAVATKFADKHDYSIDASQELIALGVCNLVGCWFQIYPVSGVLSLATVVEAAGALTPLYTVMAGIGLIICTAFLLPLFEWLPKPVLGAIVLVGIINLIDIEKMKKIWKINRKDFICMIITILVTLFVGIDYGVALGVCASIVLFIQKAAKPHYGVLGRVTNVDVVVYRNIKHHEDTETRDDMLMIRWDASIFFANTTSFKTRVRKQIGRHLVKHNYPRRWCLVLCFSGVNDIDFTGTEMLKSFFIELKTKEKGMSLVLCKLKTQVLNVLQKGGVIEVIGEDHVLWEVHEAEDWWSKRLLQWNYGRRSSKNNNQLDSDDDNHENGKNSISLKKISKNKIRLKNNKDQKNLSASLLNSKTSDENELAKSKSLIHSAPGHIAKSNDSDDDDYGGQITPIPKSPIN